MSTSSIIGKGSRVRISESGNFHGQEGTVEKIWWDKRPVEVAVKLDDLERNVVFFRGDLVLLPARKKLVEGAVIDREDIEVGMVVKSTYTSSSGEYEQTSTKQGKVVRISKGISGIVYPYAKGKTNEILLSFDNINDQVFTLIKHAPQIDEILEAVKAAKPGSVAQIEDGGAAKIILTYIKTDPAQNGTGRWLSFDTRYTYTSIVSDNTVRSKIQTLDQLVIKH